MFFLSRINAAPFSPGGKYAYKFYILERERERERERLLSSEYIFIISHTTIHCIH